jgi:anti-sigma regulatory factor (Ser/Thr protein kinase)
MLTISHDKNTIVIESDTMGAYRNEATENCLKFIKRYGAHESSGIMIVFRELLINAVQHGCASSVFQQSIKIEIKHLRNGMFKIRVTDSGRGFKYQQLDLESVPDDPRHVTNRGYRLIRMFSKEIEFNETGNSVTAYVPAQDKN